MANPDRRWLEIFFFGEMMTASTEQRIHGDRAAASRLRHAHTRFLEFGERIRKRYDDNWFEITLLELSTAESSFEAGAGRLRVARELIDSGVSRFDGARLDVWDERTAYLAPHVGEAYAQQAELMIRLGERKRSANALARAREIANRTLESNADHLISLALRAKILTLEAKLESNSATALERLREAESTRRRIAEISPGTRDVHRNWAASARALYERAATTPRADRSNPCERWETAVAAQIEHQSWQRADLSLELARVRELCAAPRHRPPASRPAQ